MPSIKINISNDLDVLNVSYTLQNEVFNNITVYPFTANGIGEGVEILNPGNTVQNLDVAVSGTFNHNVVKSVFTTSGLPFSGVYLVELNVGSEVNASVIANILLAKEVDCCIADKMYTAVDCGCDDVACNESLMDAQKMFLFKQSAEYVLKSVALTAPRDDIKRLAILTDAQNKYNKAIELCSNGCGCGNSPS